MKVLVTAGNTLVPIDRVRGITNIFTGRTGARIACHAFDRGHQVTLLTSRPEGVAESAVHGPPSGERWSVWKYRTFDDLRRELHAAVERKPDALIHCAAVSDYQTAGVYAPDEATRFVPQDGRWHGAKPRLLDRSAGKVKSDVPELWLRLVRTPKLVDLVRTDWQFPGILVKFKLEVGIDEERLLAIAEPSRRQSAADLMVANTLEGAPYWALLGPIQDKYHHVGRAELPARLLDAMEQLHQERTNA